MYEKEKEKTSECIQFNVSKSIRTHLENIYHVGIETWNLMAPAPSPFFPDLLNGSYMLDHGISASVQKWARRWQEGQKYEAEEEEEEENKTRNKQNNLTWFQFLFVTFFQDLLAFFDGVQVRRVSKASAVINK